MEDETVIIHARGDREEEKGRKDTRRKRRTGSGARTGGGVGQLVESGGMEIEEGRAVTGNGVSGGRVVRWDVAVLVVG